jgi:hypothetical protein
MTGLLRAGDRALHALFGDLKPAGHFWLYVGAGTLACAAAMCLAYGWEISLKHAVFLFCISLIAAFLPHAAHDQFEDRRYGSSAWLALLFIPLALIEFQSHAGYTAGLRGSNIETAQVQNSRYDGAQDQAKDNAALLASFKRQLEKFRSENEWATTASADGLRQQVVVLDKKVENEAARKGCKTKCEALMKERADLQERIAKVEEGNALVAKIEAMQKVVDGKRTAAAAVEHKSSAVDHQQKFLTKVANFAYFGTFTPSDAQKAELVAEGTTQAINIAMAAAATGAPALCFFIAGLYRLKRREEEDDEIKGNAQPAQAIAETGEPQRPARIVPDATRYSIRARSLADMRSQLQSMRAAA